MDLASEQSKVFHDDHSGNLDVIDDHYLQAGNSIFTWLPGRIFLGCFFKYRREPEGGSFARVADQTDLSTHHFDQLLGEGRPEAGAAILARG